MNSNTEDIKKLDKNIDVVLSVVDSLGSIVYYQIVGNNELAQHLKMLSDTKEFPIKKCNNCIDPLGFDTYVISSSDINYVQYLASFFIHLIGLASTKEMVDNILHHNSTRELTLNFIVLQ